MPLSGPSNLIVSDEWYNRLRISWDGPQFPTLGYRVIYQPISGMNTHTHTHTHTHKHTHIHTRGHARGRARTRTQTDIDAGRLIYTNSTHQHVIGLVNITKYSSQSDSVAQMVKRVSHSYWCDQPSNLSFGELFICDTLHISIHIRIFFFFLKN